MLGSSNIKSLDEDIEEFEPAHTSHNGYSHFTYQNLLGLSVQKSFNVEGIDIVEVDEDVDDSGTQFNKSLSQRFNHSHKNSYSKNFYGASILSHFSSNPICQ